MIPAKRRAAILSRVHASGVVAVNDLAKELGVSPSTIRRDLNSLHDGGELQRVRGGGLIEPDSRPFDIVATDSADEKSRIAVQAAKLIPDRSVVLLDIGTTTARLAQELRDRMVTVVTASLAVVEMFQDSQTVEVICLGGVLRRSYRSFVGNLTEFALNQLTADIGFIGTSGVSADGTILDSTGIEVPIKQAIIARSHHSVLLAASDKFPGSGLLTVCGPDGIDTLVTSQHADHPTLQHFTNHGKTVITA